MLLEFEVDVNTFSCANLKMFEHNLEFRYARRTYVRNMQVESNRCKIWCLQWCFASLKCGAENPLVAIDRTESVYTVQALSACAAQSQQQSVSICNLMGDIWHLWMLTPKRVKTTKGGFAFVYANLFFGEETDAFSEPLVRVFPWPRFYIWSGNTDVPKIYNPLCKCTHFLYRRKPF